MEFSHETTRYSRGRLGHTLLFSCLLHVLFLSLYARQSSPQTDPEYPQWQELQVTLLKPPEPVRKRRPPEKSSIDTQSVAEPLPKSASETETPRPPVQALTQPENEPRLSTPLSGALIGQALEAARASGDTDSDYHSFDFPRADARFPMKDLVQYSDSIETEQLDSGDVLVRVRSRSGKVRCFQAPVRDPFDELSSRIWMMRPC